MYIYSLFFILSVFFIFFFNVTATTEIYTLSLHDALPISICFGQPRHAVQSLLVVEGRVDGGLEQIAVDSAFNRSEEHTSELQSPYDLVCRLLLEKKKKNINNIMIEQIQVYIELMSGAEVT